MLHIEPYVGPRPFEAKDADVFFGRDTEVEELISLVQAHQVLLLYSMSGAGKTSLLRAKLAPQLEERGEKVLGLRKGGRAVSTVRVTGNAKDGPHMFVENILECLASSSDGYLSITQYAKAIPPAETPKGVPALHVLILDQFEEVFTLSPDRWNARRNLFEDLANALAANPCFRVVFALREEFVTGMDPYVGLLPGKLRTRYRLEKLRSDSAKEAINKPVENSGLGCFDWEALDFLVRSLRLRAEKQTGDKDRDEDEYVEPIFLQLGMMNLWATIKNSERSNGECFNLEDVRWCFNLAEALKLHYEKTLALVFENESLASSCKASKIGESQLRNWFSNRLLRGIRRELLERKAEETAGMPNDIVDFLIKRYLIRSETRIEKNYVELMHDRFVEPILNSNGEWIERQAYEGVDLLNLERRAIKFESNESCNLMDDREIAALTHLFVATSENRPTISDPLAHYLSVSQEKALERRVQKLTSQRRTLAGFVTLSIAIGCVAFANWIYAKSLLGRAEEAHERILENCTKSQEWITGLTEISRQAKQGDLSSYDFAWVNNALRQIGNSKLVEGRLFLNEEPFDDSNGRHDNRIYSERGNLLLVTYKGNRSIYSLKTGETVDLPNAKRGATFSADGRYVLVGLAESMRIVDSETGDPMPYMANDGADFYTGAFTPGSAWAIMSGDSPTWTAIRLAQPFTRTRVLSKENAYLSAISERAIALIAKGKEGVCTIYEVDSGRALGSVANVHNISYDGTNAISGLSPKGDLYLVYLRDSTGIYETRDSTLKWELPVQLQDDQHAMFSSQNEVVVYTSRGAREVYDISSRSRVQSQASFLPESATDVRSWLPFGGDDLHISWRMSNGLFAACLNLKSGDLHGPYKTSLANDAAYVTLDGRYLIASLPGEEKVRVTMFLDGVDLDNLQKASSAELVAKVEQALEALTATSGK